MIQDFTGWERCNDLQLAFLPHQEENLPNEGDIIVMEGLMQCYQVKILKIKCIWRNRSSEADTLYMKVVALRKIIDDDPDAAMESRVAQQEQQHIEDRQYYSPQGLHEDDPAFTPRQQFLPADHLRKAGLDVRVHQPEGEE